MIRFGLIGHGRFSKHYERLLGEIPGVKLSAIAAIHTKIRVEDIFADKSIDAVVIVTPASTHADHIEKAVKAGKHVLVEKPMVISVAQGERLRNIVSHSDKKFMVGYQFLYNDAINAIKKDLKTYGAIRYFLGEHMSGGPIRDDIGIFMDAGVHDLSIIEYLFDPGKVTDVNGKQLFYNSKKFDDFTAVTVTFENGLNAHLITSWISPEKIRRIFVVGEKKSIMYDDRAEIQKNEPLRNELEHFIDCIQNDKQPRTDFDFGLKISRNCEEILRRL